MSDTKRPCSNEKDCATEVKLKDGTVVGSVVSRTVSAKGVVEEYVKDTTKHFDKEGKLLPPLTWSPEATTGGPRNDGKMNWVDAKAYCESKKDLGLKWSLPAKEDFRVAFHPKNPDNETFPYNKRLLEALDTKDRFLWSSSVYSDRLAWGFNGYYGHVDYGSRDDDQNSVRCVSR